MKIDDYSTDGAKIKTDTDLAIDASDYEYIRFYTNSQDSGNMA